MTEHELFAAAIKLTGDQRAAFLTPACGSDAGLREQVEALLRAHDESGGLLPKHSDPRLDVTQSPPGQATVGMLVGRRYKLLEAIGEGGMGTVWMAEQREPVKRKVAVKLVKPGMDSRQVLARFEAERQALALMDHPNIAKVFDGGVTEQGRPFFVMEYVKGVPLTEYCDLAKLSLKERLNLFIPVCQAVQHAHQKGIIHRDLKPSNILICLYDGKPVPKVIDFGLAKAMHQSLTEQTLHTAHGMMVGTPLYMSPEQAEHNNLDVDTRSDIYSLGVILYELLTGSTPLEKQQLKEAAFNEILRLIKEIEPPKPSTRLSGSINLPSIAAQRSIEPNQLRRSLSGDLDWIVMKALDKERSRRYETANGLARDVERYLKDEAVEACPPSTSYRLRKLIRKHRTALGTVAAFTMLMAIGTGIATWQAIRATRAEAVARQSLTAEAEQRQRAEDKQREAEQHRAKAQAAAKAEAQQRQVAEEQQKKAELAEAQTLADYRASTDDSIAQLIGSKDELGPQEKAYLEKTVKRWQSFANRRGDDVRSRAIRAEGHYRIGFLWQKLGRILEACAEYEVARDIQLKLVEQFPTEAAYQAELLKSRFNLATTFSELGKWVESRREFEAAKILAKKLISQFPTAAVHQEGLVGIHINFGNLFVMLGQPTEAGLEYQEARGLAEKLALKYPEVAHYQSSLASSHNNLGLLHSREGRLEEARAEFQAASNIQSKLVARFPSVPTYQLSLATYQGNLGGTLLRLGKVEPARKEYQAALDIRKKLAEQFPAVPAYQNDLARSYSALGSLFFNLKEQDDNLGGDQSANEDQDHLIEQLRALPEYETQDSVDDHQSGSLRGDLGFRQEARAAYQAARDIRKRLAAQFPTQPKFRAELADSLHVYGWILQNLGKRPEARVEYQAARDVRRKLAEQFPEVFIYQQQLVHDHKSLGAVFKELGQRQDARVEYQAARDLLQKAVEKFPNEPDRQSHLAGTRMELGRVLHELGQKPEAKAEFQAAWDLHQKLVERFPGEVNYKVAFGRSYVEYGNLLRNTGDPDKSLSWFDLAIQTLQPVVIQNPEHPTAKWNLSNAHAHRAYAHAALKKLPEAADDWRLVVELSKPSGLAWSKSRYGWALFRLGKLEDAERELDQSLALQAQAAREAGTNAREPNWIHAQYVRDRANVYREGNRLVQAAAWFGRAIREYTAIQKRWPGPEVTTQLRLARENRLQVFEQIRKSGAADADWKSVIELGGPDERASANFDYGTALVQAGRTQEADLAFNRALELYERAAKEAGTDAKESNWLLANCLWDCGLVYFMGGWRQQSIDWFGRAIEKLSAFQKQWPGAEVNNRLQWAHQNRAVAFGLMKKHTEAIQEWDQAIKFMLPADQLQGRTSRAMWLPRLGRTSEAIAEVMELAKDPKCNAQLWYNFASVYVIASEVDAMKKQEYADRAIEMLTKSVEAGWKNVGNTIKDINFNTLRDRDDFRSLMLRMVREQLVEARKTLPQDSPELATVLARLGLNLLTLKEWSDAEPILRESLAFREKTYPDAWNTFEVKSRLGGSLLGQKKYAEAEPLLLVAHEGLQQRKNLLPNGDRMRPAEALERLVELYTAWNKPEQAAEWRKKLDQETTPSIPESVNPNEPAKASSP